MNLADIQAIEYWVVNNRARDLCVHIAGQVFGGKRGEAPQSPERCIAVDDTVIIYFKGKERLWVKNPENITVADYGLSIEKASVVKWGWYFYGRPQIDLNWCEEIYHIAVNEVTIVRAVPITVNWPTFEKYEFNRDNVVSIK